MVIQTERLSIRFVENDDWKRIKEIWNDIHNTVYAQYDKPNNTDDPNVQERIEKWAAANAADTKHMFFAICLNDKLIGYCAFNAREKGYEIGYCFDLAYHRNGYAKESISALLHYLSGKGITKFIAGTAIENTPSVSLLKSLGFIQVGTEKVSFYQDSQGNDIVFDGGVFEIETDES